jgi:hypothetical protein
LKRFNKEMFKVNKLIDLVALKALISGVKEHYLWKNLYALLGRSLLKVKQAMKNHIWVEEASMLRYGPLYFYQEVEDKKSFKWNRSPTKDNNSKKCHKRAIRECMQYPERRYTTPLNITLTKVLTTIKRKDFVQYSSLMVSPSHTHTHTYEKFCLFHKD